MVRRKLALVGSTALMAAICVTPRPALPQQATAEVKQLLLLMDKDRNGKVSREEFMRFMAAEFDRLDVNHNEELDVNELAGLRISPGRHPAVLAPNSVAI
jgi:hypothetical protein